MYFKHIYLLEPIIYIYILTGMHVRAAAWRFQRREAFHIFPRVINMTNSFSLLSSTKQNIISISSTRWCPPSYNLVIRPLTIDISPINHCYLSYVHQLSYRTGTAPNVALSG